jgi:Lon-like protease
VQVQGEKDRPGPGGIYMVDVVIRKASLLERYFPGIHQGASLVPAKVYNPQGLSETVQRQQGLEEMTSSQETAAAVALRHLGYDVKSNGVEVSAIDVGAPADGVLKPGDVILEANGTPISTTDDLTAVMS